MKKEILILGIICLFVGVGIQPAYAVEISNVRPSEDIDDCNCEVIDDYNLPNGFCNILSLFVSNSLDLRQGEEEMNWKEFLKPDWRKVIIFIIGEIFILSIYYSYANYVMIAISTPIQETFITWIVPFLIFVLPVSLIWYLLSCLIIWIYDKRKRK